MSSSSTLFNNNPHYNHQNGMHILTNANNTSHNLATASTSNLNSQLNSASSALQSSSTSAMQKANPAYVISGLSSTTAPSPTISLISSSSSSSGSSPIQHLNNTTNKTSQLSNNNNSNNNGPTNIIFANNSSNISAAKKIAALQNIAASIAKSQQLASFSNSNLNNVSGNNANGVSANNTANLTNKILALTIENNGVACSLVKSNTNIYYNSKVDTAASKAIHYCTHCTNSDCRAIHKSLSKPLLLNNNTTQSIQSANGGVQLLNGHSNNGRLTNQQIGRLFLSPQSQQQQQTNHQIQAKPQMAQQLKHSLNTSQQQQQQLQQQLQQQQQQQQQQQNNNQNSQFNKLLGANINFIFERRYPLVQLNSNLLNAISSNAGFNNNNTNSGPTHSTSSSPINNERNAQNLIDFISSNRSSLMPLSAQSLSNFNNANNGLNITPEQQRQMLMSRSAAQNGLYPSSSLASHEDLTDLSSSSSPPGVHSFPVSKLENNTNNKPKSTSFSINFNRLSNNQVPNANTVPQPPQQQQSQQQIVQQLPPDDFDSSLSQSDSSFPINLNNLSLRYKNILFLEQFNKDQRPQSPNTPRDPNEKLKTAAAVTAPSTQSAITSSTNQQTPTNVSNGTPSSNTKVAVKPKNEKEIQIQRVSSSPSPSPSSVNEITTVTSNTNNNSNNTNKLKLSQSPIPITSQSLPVTNSPNVNQTDLSKSNNLVDLQPISSNLNATPSKTPVNVSNNTTVTQQQTITDLGTAKAIINNTNVQAIAATVAASIESATAKAKLQQQNAQMNSKILATLNSKIQQKQAQIPQFHFPNGKPDEKQFKDDSETMKLVSAEFRLQKDSKIFKENFAEIVKIIGLPRYWKILLFRACTMNNKLNYITYPTFEQVWTKLNQTCNDKPSLFVKLISSTNAIVYDDWEPLMQDIVDTHPGLKFLHDHKEFHTRYIKTVIARIYYTVNRSWSGKITLTELKRSNFLSVLESLELEDDINLIKDYFSYEHFYVIYCKFWELDKDHDLLISKEDLYRHNNYAISPRVIDRIFSGTVIRGKDWRDNLMSYYDFVWFLISEEDKRNTTSIEYWFRVLDLDGDGVLSMYELEYFYNEQIEQMRERQIEYMPFTDLLCQILDLVKPTESGKIHLKDLKQCKMTNVFFDTFINLEKYLEYEQRDPFSNMRDLEGPELSDWEKYAADEYENLVSEDVNADNQDFNYEDDFEDENMYNNGNNPNGFNNIGTNGNNGSVNPGNSPVGQQQQQQQGSWIGNNNMTNSLAGDSQAATTGAGNRNRLLLNNSPTSPTLNSPNTNTSSFITNRSSFDER